MQRLGRMLARFAVATMFATVTAAVVVVSKKRLVRFAVATMFAVLIAAVVAVVSVTVAINVAMTAQHGRNGSPLSKTMGSTPGAGSMVLTAFSAATGN